MWNWFKRNRAPKVPGFHREVIGEVVCRSGTIVLDDPWHTPVRVEGVPTGPVPVEAEFIRYPEGGVRVAMVRLCVRPGEHDSRRELGKVGVDSGTVIAIDDRTLEECWQHVGPERIGHTSGVQHRAMARAIAKRFKLSDHPVNGFSSEFAEPISEELEKEIRAFLQGAPEFMEFCFWVKTNDTTQRIYAAMEDRLWAEVSLGPNPRESLLAVSSGFGDGSYPVEGLYHGGDLVAAEVRFIGPEQDKVLEAFPMLRE